MNESLAMDGHRRMTIGVIARYCCQSSTAPTCTILQYNIIIIPNRTWPGPNDVRSPRSVAWRLIASIPKNTTDRFSLVPAGAAPAQVFARKLHSDRQPPPKSLCTAVTANHTCTACIPDTVVGGHVI